MSQNKSVNAGRIGNCASIACAIHCMAMPLLISILPAFGIAWLESEWFEIALILVAIGFSLLSLCWGYKSHKKLRAFAFLLGGAVWFGVAHASEMHWISLLGGISLIAANWLNRRMCKSCTDCCKH